MCDFINESEWSLYIFSYVITLIFNIEILIIYKLSQFMGNNKLTIYGYL